ncbi:hypothetical protein TIFTF001_034144 [Ficus carica]|uniref:Uncharacterized protein n=1 Tax=Ficus carica TaxID=3494 RepID=A0AA88DZV3_FICCA|nr:hypothetical protein TIFTF001_034144 [Ficus carica]
MDGSLSFTTHIPSNVATHRNANLPLVTFVVPSMGGSQSTMALTPYSPLHPLASLASLMNPLTFTTIGTIPLGSTLHGKAIAEVPNCHDIIALFALKKGLLSGSNILNEICSWRPRTIVEALARDQRMIEAEELEKVTRMEQYNYSRRAFSFFESKRNNDHFDRRNRGRIEAHLKDDRSNQ